MLRILLNFCEEDIPNGENFRSMLWRRGQVSRMLVIDRIHYKDSGKVTHFDTALGVCIGLLGQL